MDLGKFEIIEELGKGGFGTVFKARDKVLKRQVALKFLHPNLSINPDFIFRFKHEAQLAARLDHPNLLPVYDFGEFRGLYYIVMAYMPAGSLKDMLYKEGALGKQRSLKIFEEICEGLAYAHNEKILHRDLKPENILFDNRGISRISDMGFAKLIHSENSASLSINGGMVGTPAYMAPEIWRGNTASPATDVYSLACVLVEMLTGELLFGGVSIPEIILKHLEPFQFPEGVPEEWKPVLAAALEKNQDKRIQSVREFLNQIKGAELQNFMLAIEPAKSEDAIEKYLKDNSKNSGDLVLEYKKTNEVKQNQEYHENQVLVPLQKSQTSEENRSYSTESRSESGRDPVIAEDDERKSKTGLKYVVFAVYAIFIGIITFLIWISNTKPAYTPPPAPATALPMNAITKTPIKTSAESVLGVGSTQTRQKDGMEQVYIPAGEFIMGTDQGIRDEKPERLVYLDSYWIDKYEVTNGLYGECVASGTCTEPHESKSSIRNNYYGDPSYAEHPVINVDWNQANAYCKWANEGKDGLPTEAQWEKAARGVNGNIYPWGNSLPNKALAVYATNDTYTVGSKPAGKSYYGAMDMAGNVWEWVSDWYAPYDTTDISNPHGPSDPTEYRILRGGSWYYYGKGIQSTVRRSIDQNGWSGTTGFRCTSSIASEAATKTPAQTATEAALRIGSTKTREIDDMEQVYVPAGDFIMGSEDGESDAYDIEKPKRLVFLDSFWIDKYEVTNGQYQKCVENGPCIQPYLSESHTRSSYYGNSPYTNYPVIYVDWNQVKAYCEWAGGDLPTEAQWEKAARGTEGWNYPWGNKEPDSSYANYGWNVDDTTEVGSYEKGASPYGAMDMAGNVFEWVSDWYADKYDANDTYNPQGAESGNSRVIRGGSWRNNARSIRTAIINSGVPSMVDLGTGFRCVSPP